MRNKGNTLRERSSVDIGPIYDLPTINNEQQEQVIDMTNLVTSIIDSVAICVSVCRERKREGQRGRGYTILVTILAQFSLPSCVIM